MARKERTRLMDICDSEIYERTVRGSHTRNTRADGAAVSSRSCETADQSTVRACRVATTASLRGSVDESIAEHRKLRRTPDVSVLVKTHRAASVDIHEEIVVPSRPTSGRPTISSSTTSDSTSSRTTRRALLHADKK